MQIRKCAVAAACFGLFGASLFAETLTVTSNADSGEGTLRALLASANADDVIEIPAGMTITLESMLTLPKMNVTIRGNGTTSIISGNDTVQMFEINYGKAVRYGFENLVLEKGYSAAQTKTVGSTKIYDGSAGIKLTSAANATVVMTDCTVRDMSVNVTGTSCSRGVFMHGGANTFDFYATNTVFTGLWGGCAVISVGNNYGHSNRNFVLSKCKLINNGDKNGHLGASLLDVATAEGGVALLDKCIITGNVSSNSTAAAIAHCSSNKAVTWGYLFKDCIITNNATLIGSGMFNMGYGRHRFENCVISDNQAFNNAIYVSSSQKGYGVEFINCTMERNAATEIGNAYNKMGLFFVRQPPTAEYDEIVLVSNCVIRANNSSCASFVGTYDAGGILRFVDTEISDNIVRGTKVTTGSKTNVFTRCAIVRNYSNPLYTSESSDGLFAGAYTSFDNCLIASNDMRRTRYVFSTLGAFVGCTIVSNTCSSAWTYPALEPQAGSVLVDTVVLGSVCSADHTKAEVDVSCSKGPAVTNCFFERASFVASAIGTGIVTGKTMSDLKLDWNLSTNGSKTVFLDGTRMPAMTFAKDSLLRDAGVEHPLLGKLDLIRGKRRANKLRDIGCWEFPEPDGLMFFVK